MSRKRSIAFEFALYTQILFWVVFCFMLLFSFVNAGSTLDAAMLAAALLLACHLCNFYIVYGWLTPVCFEKRRYLSFALGTLILLLSLTPLRMWVENHYIHRPFLVVRGRILRWLVLFSEISIACFAFLFRMAVDSQRHIKRAADIERLQLQTELKFLKFQIHPHFLFNTINNVYSLSLSGSANTPAALLKLSGLLRYLLYECNHRVPLSKELDALAAYIDLFQLRYEERLDIRLDISLNNRLSSRPDNGAAQPCLPSPMVEPMLLIPLLENAIKHSGIGVSERAWIAIAIQEDETGVLATIRNSKPAMDAVDPVPAGGIGLKNIKKRLEMLGSDPKARDLSIDETKDTFEIRLKIPD